MKVSAAVLEAFGQPLVVQQLDLEGPRAGEVLVRLHACGVCHTDMYSASGADPSGYAPAVLGHEGAGVVEAIGEGVRSVAVGDHVVTCFNPQCRECVNCASGKTNICVAIRAEQGQGHLPDGTTRFSRSAEGGGSEGIRHFMGCSTFAEATVVPEIALAKIDPEAPLEHASLFACGLTTGLGAAMYAARVEAGSTAVVFGAGMVGLGAVAGCRIQQAERIVCVDLSEDRLAMARRHGATDTIVAHDGIVEELLELTGGYGADCTFEATGLVGVMRQAVETARLGWGLCTVAGVAGKGEELSVIPRWLMQGRVVQGASFGKVRSRDQVPELVRLGMEGQIDVEGFISHRMGLADVNRGFELMHAQDGVRTVLQLA